MEERSSACHIQYVCVVTVQFQWYIWASSHNRTCPGFRLQRELFEIIENLLGCRVGKCMNLVLCIPGKYFFKFLFWLMLFEQLIYSPYSSSSQPQISVTPALLSYSALCTCHMFMFKGGIIVASCAFMSHLFLSVAWCMRTVLALRDACVWRTHNNTLLFSLLNVFNHSKFTTYFESNLA